MIDDPTLEINDKMLENELNELIKNKTIRNEIENDLLIKNIYLIIIITVIYINKIMKILNYI